MIEKRKIQWRKKKINEKKKERERNECDCECVNLHYMEICNFFFSLPRYNIRELSRERLMFVAFAPRNRANRKKRKKKKERLIKKFSSPYKIYIYKLNFYQPPSIPSPPPVLHFIRKFRMFAYNNLQPSVRLKVKNCCIPLYASFLAILHSFYLSCGYIDSIHDRCNKW